MIASNLDNYEKYLFNKDFTTTFNYLVNEDLAKLDYGKHEINNNIYVIKENYYTRQLGETFWEGHENFIDIQFILSGEERIAYSQVNDLDEIIYHKEKDLKIFKGPVSSFIHLKKNDFGIFFPEDAHMPGLVASDSPSDISKIIVKIKVK